VHSLQKIHRLQAAESRSATSAKVGRVTDSIVMLSEAKHLNPLEDSSLRSE
jgi:hypothetical protein